MMIKIRINTRNATLVEKETITSGSVGIAVHFEFSDDWEGLAKTAVFSDGTITKDVVLTTNECFIPPECLTTEGRSLRIGIYGTNDENIVIPTIYCWIGQIKKGTEISGDPSIPPTPSVVEQILVAATNAEALARSVRNDADAGVFDGAAGYSPVVSIDEIEGGHSVTITDKDHPEGQSFNVMDGQGGGASTWEQITGKPFKTLGETLQVDAGGVLNIVIPPEYGRVSYNGFEITVE